ncbi:MAG: hypothetical protein KZQ75_10190 [Candidatus Thiodiazotropha sp. (ex Myrtea spinifera)]|nr:hypothetical protein [Candidatus Thiodiazotropha sp. (ex Myrtea spinifera)]
MIIRLFGVLVVLVVLIGLAIYVVFGYQERYYADDYFSFIDHDGVLESRKWHNKTFGCTYAIVSIVDAAKTNPPIEWIDSSLWHQTPLLFKEERKAGQCRNLICECEYDLTPDTYQRLTRALSEPGSFYYLGWRQPPHDPLYQGSILVYSSAQKIAAKVRFGD